MLRARPARGRAGSGSRSRPPDAAPGLVLGGIVGAGRPEGCHGSATRADAGKEVRENRANGAENAEPPVGFEPTTARLRIESSTTELRWRGYAATTYRIGREVYAVVPMVVDQLRVQELLDRAMAEFRKTGQPNQRFEAGSARKILHDTFFTSAPQLKRGPFRGGRRRGRELSSCPSCLKPLQVASLAAHSRGALPSSYSSSCSRSRPLRDGATQAYSGFTDISPSPPFGINFEVQHSVSFRITLLPTHT